MLLAPFELRLQDGFRSDAHCHILEFVMQHQEAFSRSNFGRNGLLQIQPPTETAIKDAAASVREAYCQVNSILGKTVACLSGYSEATQQQRRGNHVKNVLVGNLSSNLTPELRTVFQSYGAVERIEIVTDANTGYSRSFARR